MQFGSVQEPFAVQMASGSGHCISVTSTHYPLSEVVFLCQLASSLSGSWWRNPVICDLLCCYCCCCCCCDEAHVTRSVFVYYHSGCQFLETPSIDSPALSNVTTLFLNEMNLTWNKVIVHTIYYNEIFLMS